MVDRIGRGSLAQEAIRAALESQSRAAASIREQSAQIGQQPTSTQAVDPSRIDFSQALREGVDAVEGQIRKAEALPSDLVTGKVDDFHEVAVQLKQADLTFKFAMEIRNKLLDAYREVMRMQV
jgi:flagellar hook-basal body complex protein FliE